MANRPPIFWLTKDAQTDFFPIWLSGFTPVQVWSTEQQSFTDEQLTTAEGLPIYEASAMIHLGYRGELSPVKVRVATRDTPPVVHLISETLELSDDL